MPWETSTDAAGCDGVAVVNKQTGKVMGCHDDEESAKRQVRALYANVENRVEALELAVQALARVEFGEFHGNQYVDADGNPRGDRDDDNVRSAGEGSGQLFDAGPPGVSPADHKKGLDAIDRVVKDNPKYREAADEVKDGLTDGETTPEMVRNQVIETLEEMQGDAERGVNYSEDEAADYETYANRVIGLVDLYESPNDPDLNRPSVWKG